MGARPRTARTSCSVAGRATGNCGTCPQPRVCRQRHSRRVFQPPPRPAADARPTERQRSCRRKKKEAREIEMKALSIHASPHQTNGTTLKATSRGSTGGRHTRSHGGKCGPGAAAAVKQGKSQGGGDREKRREGEEATGASYVPCSQRAGLYPPPPHPTPPPHR